MPDAAFDAGVDARTIDGALCPSSPLLSPLPRTPRLAVVLSDFRSTAIAMLDADGVVLDETWLHSGTVPPRIIAALSGDVVLPSSPPPSHSLFVLDRFRTDVLTRLCVPDGSLVGQLRTHTDAPGFSSNPHDVAFVADDEAWVSRHGKNLTPGAATDELGDDLIRIDPRTMQRVPGRVDLSSFDSLVSSTLGGETRDVIVFARPSRVVPVGELLVVGLGRLSADFTAADEGMVAIVDPATETAVGLSLAPMKSCGEVVPVPGDDSRALVACTGFAQPFGDEGQVRASAGLAMLVAEAGAVRVEHLWRADLDTAGPIVAPFPVALSATEAMATDWGDVATDTPDRLYRVDLRSGATELVYESSEAFALGTPAYDPETNTIWLPDAAVGVVVLTPEESSFVVERTVEIGVGLGVPPRHVHLL